MSMGADVRRGGCPLRMAMALGRLLGAGGGEGVWAGGVAGPPVAGGLTQLLCGGGEAVEAASWRAPLSSSCSDCSTKLGLRITGVPDQFTRGSIGRLGCMSFDPNPTGEERHFVGKLWGSDCAS